MHIKKTQKYMYESRKISSKRGTLCNLSLGCKLELNRRIHLHIIISRILILMIFAYNLTFVYCASLEIDEYSKFINFSFFLVQKQKSDLVNNSIQNCAKLNFQDRFFGSGEVYHGFEGTHDVSCTYKRVHSLWKPGYTWQT